MGYFNDDTIRKKKAAALFLLVDLRAMMQNSYMTSNSSDR